MHFCFAGYSVGAGHFLASSSTEVIGGAPQQEQTGKVRDCLYCWFDQYSATNHPFISQIRLTE